MLFPIKTICEPKKARRDGTSLIYFQYCYNSEQKTLLNSKIAIPAKYWSKRKLAITTDLPTSYGDYGHLNSELTRMNRVLEDIIEYANNMNIENIGMFVKDVFKPEMQNIPELENTLIKPVYISRKTQPDLFKEIDDYILSKERKVCPKALSTYKSMKDHLLAYQAFSKKPVTFNSFDFNFYEKFVDYLSFDYRVPRKKEPVYGLKTNTIGKTIKQLRIFVADRVKRKIIAPIDMSDFKIPDEETDSIYLSHEEIALLYNADLTQTPHLIEYRDLFVLASLTGLRFSDFSTLKPENLRDNKLHKKQGKSDHWVVIPLRKEAKEIFTSQFQERIPHLTNAEFNRHIKTIGKIAGIDTTITFASKKGNKDIVVSRPKYEWITTHTARRSFCTNEFLAGTPAKLIMKISGHKNEKQFYRYIRITPLEAANKMEEIWIQRDSMKALSA